MPDTQGSLRPPVPVMTSQVAEGEDEQKEEVWERRGKEGAREDWKEGRKEEGREGRRRVGGEVEKVLKRARCKREEDRRREGRRVT